MTYGFRCKNDFGTYQIDERFLNLAFKSKSRILGAIDPTDPRPSGERSCYWEVEPTGDFPVVAVRCTTGQVVVGNGVGFSPSDPTKAMMAFSAQSTSALYLDVYLFDIIPPSPTLPPYGLVVRHPSTEAVVFHSGCRPMVVAHDLSLSLANQGTTYALDPSRTYAVCYQGNNGGAGFADVNVGGGHQQRSLGLETPNGGSYGTQTYVIAQTFPGNIGANYEVPGSGWIVDVTGL